MGEFNHAEFVRVLRANMGGKVPAEIYQAILPAIEAGLRTPAAVPLENAGEPAWLVAARELIGTREVVGKQHNPKILDWVKSLRGWFKDDETPWCGTFVAICMRTNSQPVPEHWYRALAWKAWGKSCVPCVGAVAVFGREGGGHVGFLVGESVTHYYVLGGNQANAVNIMPIGKERLIATRWPAALRINGPALPSMTGGIVSRNEA